MSQNDFETIWNLFRRLFPASPRVKGEKEKRVWGRALKPYGLEDVTESVMAWARKSKFFPDVADITGKLTPVETTPEIPPDRKERLYGDTAWMAPYIRKMAAKITDAESEEIQAAGLMTWGEAEKNGIDFFDWNLEYRKKFPVFG